MKLINETVYNSDDLRALFAFLLERLGGDKDKTIRVVYSRRGGGIGGHANVGEPGRQSRRLTITLPGPSYPWPSEKANVEHLAQVFEHELAHNRGLQHGEMERGLLNCAQPVPLGTSGFTVRRADPEGVEYVYRCPHGHDERTVRQPLRGWDLRCRAIVLDGLSGWAPRRGAPPYENEDPPGKFLCGQRMKLTLRKLSRSVSNLDAARTARTAQAEAREVRLRRRLAVAELELKRAQRKVSKLRVKVRYYDHRAAARPKVSP